MTTKKRYGWRPDLPDQRDQLLYTVGEYTKLPPVVNLLTNNPWMPSVYDQGNLGSCTANAIAAAIEFEMAKQGQSFFPARLFIYYNERLKEHTVDSDSGAQIRDGIKSVSKQGVCAESFWPYIEQNFKEAPTKGCYSVAKKDLVSSYLKIKQNLHAMKYCLAKNFPFVFGFSVYESFESDLVARTGIAGLPIHGETIVGGHAVLCVGYDDAKGVFICRNSWGSSWGQSGYFTLPYDYLLNPDLSSDFWTIRMVD